MINNGGRVMQNVKRILNGYFKMIPVSHAEDSSGTAVPSGKESITGFPQGIDAEPVVLPNPQVNYEDLIARARKEEKDKLYPQIKDLQGKLGAMTKLNNDNLLKVAALEKQLADIQNNKSEDKEVENLKTELNTLKTEYENYKKSAPDETALREQIKKELDAEYAVKQYRLEKLSSESVKADVLPVFFEEIKGNTEEDIDKAIALAAEKTKQVREQLGVTAPATQTAAPEREVAPRSVIPNDPLKNGFGSGTDLNYVANLPADSPEYAEWRKKMGLK